MKEGKETNGDIEIGGTEEGEDEELIEIPDDDEGAVWPLKGTLRRNLLGTV